MPFDEQVKYPKWRLTFQWPRDPEDMEQISQSIEYNECEKCMNGCYISRSPCRSQTAKGWKSSKEIKNKYFLKNRKTN